MALNRPSRKFDFSDEEPKEKRKALRRRDSEEEPSSGKLTKELGRLEKSMTGRVAESRLSTIRFDQVVSTGHTLLDLNISGNRVRGGGLPGGIVVEIFGKSGTGKTAILEEIAASIQARRGEAKYLDPEGRLDMEYARIYGVELNKDNYERPDTVTEMFDYVKHVTFKRQEVINGVMADSLAALSTKMEMEAEEGDKRGQKRAKEFSEGFRKTARIIAKNNWLLVCSNQVREGEHGYYSPGGQAIPFYSSLRIKTMPVFKTGVSPIVFREEEVNRKKVKRAIGIRTDCEVVKSSLDDPYRKCVVSIIFGYGLDDIRDNLQYLKDFGGYTSYPCFDRKFVSMDQAISYIEEKGYRERLREEVIDLWEEIEKKFQTKRKKVRF